MNTKFFILAILFLSSIDILRADSSPAQKVGQQFMAATVSDVSAFFRAQPNCNGAVGPEQYVEFTNHNVRSFNKKTGQPDGVLDQDSATFLGTVTADTMMTYDRWGQRWIMTGDLVDLTNPNYPVVSVAIAWSDGPVLTKETRWSLYHFQSSDIYPPNGALVDSPKLSSDANAVYINVDTFSNIEFSEFSVSSIVIPQSSFKEGQPFNFTVFPGLFSNIEFPDVGGLAFAPSPDNYDPNPEFGYIIVSPSLEVPGVFTYTNYFMLRILNPGSDHPTLYPTAAHPISLEAPLYTDVGTVPHLGNLYGVNGYLQNSTGLDFGMPHIRHKQLYFVINGLVDSTGTGTLTGDRSAILWYQYDLTGDSTGQGRGIETVSTVPALVQSGVIFDPTTTTTPINYWNGAIMSDKDGNLAIIGNSAGENNYIQAFYTGRKAKDPLGTLRSLTLLSNNTSSYNFGTLLPTDANSQRWGDYCSLKPDPCNDRDLWATSQVVAFQDGWGILATQLKPTKGGKKKNRHHSSNYKRVKSEKIEMTREKSGRPQQPISVVEGGNLIAFNKGNGILMRNGSSVNTVDGNTIVNNRKNGVKIETCSFDNLLTGNVIKKNRKHGVVSIRRSGNQLSDNSIKHNRKSNIKEIMKSRKCISR